MARFDAFRTILCDGCKQTVTKRLRKDARFCSAECYHAKGHSLTSTGWNGPNELRFWKRIVCDLKTKCWLWIGPTHQRGYGRGWFFGKQRRATHVSWYLTTGEWPKLAMLHKCNNTRCVNPDHIYDGTPKDNFMDMIRSGTVVFGRPLHSEAN